jgi:putative transposase
MLSLKGETSHWFNNRSGFEYEKLIWQEKYYAVSVSDSLVPVVKAYIDRQVEHHQKVTFLQEYAEMVKTFGFMAMPVGS